MKIFLSWSGPRSKRVAEIFREWLRFVFHNIEPWMSSEDIIKGKRWSPEIAQALEDAKVGVICLTKENLNRPWLLFEAGALSKVIKTSLVCTFLLDGEQADIGNDNPLSQFQATKNSKDDILVLLKTINEAYGKDKLDDKILVTTFERFWDDFETKISSIPHSQIDGGKLPVRKDSELLAEILETVRNIERKSGVPVRVRMVDASGNMVDASGNIVDASGNIVLPAIPSSSKEFLRLSSETGRKSLTWEEALIRAKRSKKERP